MYDVFVVEENKATQLCTSVDLNFAVGLCASIFERAKSIHLRILETSSQVCVIRWKK